MSYDPSQVPGRMAASGRPMGPRVLVVEKGSVWGPRILWVAAVMGLLSAILWAPWIPRVPRADGLRWWMSGWDWVACWRHDQAMGRPGTASFKPSVEAWRIRMERDPGSVEATRGWMDSMVASGEPLRAPWEAALGTGRTLLKLSNTNAADLGRLLRWSLRAGEGVEGLAVVKPWADRLGDEDRFLYLLTSADHGDWDEVVRGMATKPVAGEPGQLLSWAVGVARGGGDGSSSRDAVKGLERAAGGQDPELRKVAGLLRMACAVERMDATMAGAALEGLRREGRARLLDHVRVAVLRDRSGGSGVGTDRESWPAVAEWREVLPWTRWLRARGDERTARREWLRALETWDTRAHWLEAVGEALSQADWVLVDVMGDALVRGTPRVRDWDGLGHALVAMSKATTGEKEAADRSVEAMVRAPLPVDGWPMAWCRVLGKAGRLAECEPWLLALEKDHGTDSEYWRLRMGAAMGVGDLEGWLKATERAASTKSGDVELGLDRAWGGLVLGRDPLDVLKAMEDDDLLLKGGTRGQLLTAWAWARAGNYGKAEASLRLVEGLAKEAGDRNLLGLVWFELLLRSGRGEEAWKRYGTLDVARLPGPLGRWLDKEASKLSDRLLKERAAKVLLDAAGEGR